MSHKINIPGIGNIEYCDSKNENYTFYTFGSIRWQISDKYGWAIGKDVLRDIKIDDVLGNKIIENCMYNIYLRKEDESGWGQYSITFDKKIIKLYSTSTSDSSLRIDLKCDSFEDAEKFVIMLMDGNNLTLSPISQAGFKQ